MQTIRSILVYLRDWNNQVVDGAIVDPSFRRALSLATRTGARIHVVDVLPPLTPGSSRATSLYRRFRELGRSLLSDAIKPYAGKQRMTADILVGDPAAVLVEQATRGRYDLVVKTARPAPGSLAPYGEVARKLIRYCPCPVLVAKEPPLSLPNIVVAAVGPTWDSQARELNREVIATALELAHFEDCELHVIHAWNDRDPAWSRQDAASSLWHFLASEGATLHPRMVHLVNGEPDEVIPRFCQQRSVSCVVVGTFGRIGIERALRANTAEKMLSHLVPGLMAVKSRFFSAPAVEQMRLGA